MQFFRPLPGALLAVLLVVPPAMGDGANITGQWQATEFDPYIPENPFFGQFRYDLTISKQDDGYEIRSNRTGARLTAPALNSRRLVATGDDPARGKLRLDVIFDVDRFEGILSVNGREKRITATLDPTVSLARTREATEQITAETDAMARRATSAEQAAAALQDRVAQLEQALNLSEARRRTAETALADTERQLRARPAATPRQTATNQSTELTITVIEPPMATENGAVTVVPGQPIELVGRVSGPSPLFSSSLNGSRLQIDSNGLFRVELTPSEGQQPIRLVAVDRDGRRAESAFTMQAATAEPARQITADDQSANANKPPPAAQTPRMRCYEQAILAQRPDEQAPEICRQALADPAAAALDHYHLAVVLSRLGRHQEALAAYRDAAAGWSR